jgi:hypothetical protein
MSTNTQICRREICFKTQGEPQGRLCQACGLCGSDRAREKIHARLQGRAKNRRKKGAHRAALKELWKELPNSDRNEIGQLLAQMIARKILPPKPEEGSYE